MEVVEKPTLDLLNIQEPALSATSDMPVIETKPDSQAKPEAKVEAKPDTKPVAVEPKAKEFEVAAPVEGKTSAESAPAETPEDDPAANAEPVSKPAKGVQKRIDELVRQREEEKAEKLRLLSMLEGLQKPKPEQPVVEEDLGPQRPSRDAFTDTNAYEAALNEYADAKASWSARREVKAVLAEEKRNVEQRQIAEGQRLAREAYSKRVEKVTEEFPDYKAVAENPDVHVSIPVAHVIMHSEHGPKIAYHLGKNREEAQRISLLNPADQLVEIGLLVARLSAPAAKAEVAPAQQPKPAVSAAPKPIKPLNAIPETPSKSPQDESMEEYTARRKSEMAAERRPGART